MSNISKEQILASSSGWVAALLNVLPGLGTGYIYQRRWLPYFLSSGVSLMWFVTGMILKGDKELTQNEQFIGISVLCLISAITAIESYLASKKAFKLVQNNKVKTKMIKKKGLFK